MQHGAAAELLARTPLFRNIGGESLTAILMEGSELLEFGVGQALALAGHPATAAILIVDGEVGLKTAEGDDLDMSLGAGSFLSQMAMFIETTHVHSAVATGQVLALALNRDNIGPLIMQMPHLAGVFAGNIRNNLAETADTLRQLDRQLEESMPEVVAFDDTPVAQIAFNAPAEDHAGSAGASSPLAVNGAEQGEGAGDSGYNVYAFNGPSAELDLGRENATGGDNPIPIPIQDLLADLKAASGQTDQTPQGPGHGPTAFPSRGPRRLPEATQPRSSEPELPRHGQAAAHG